MWFFIILFIVCIFWMIKSIDYNVEKGKEEKQKIENIKQQGLENYNAIYSAETNHVCGLPLAENSNCTIHLCDNQIVVESVGNIFKLQRNKIMDMNLKTSKEIQNSISGAVGGYILLGPIGAFLGGSSTEFHRFFIIIYKNKENQEQCISFDLKDDLKIYKEIYNYIEQFKDYTGEKKEIEI